MSTAKEDTGSTKIQIEDLCRARPEVPEVMAEIFDAYKFEFGAERMLPGEVFACSGFLPILSHLACARINDLFGIPFPVDQDENEIAILGVEVNPSFRSLASTVIYMVNLVQVSQDIFGVIPGKINIDDLYEWAMDREMQLKGLPYLGQKH